jgi:predicted RNA-binding Zn-ribbon protein involved in translation (DUF1610 family)
MRKIKFRIWDQNKNNYVFSDCFDGNCAVEQFTGFTDKDGKDIYEGDLIYYKFKMDEHGQWENHTGEVYFDDGSWCVDKSFSFYLSEVKNTAVVIGNINETSQCPHCGCKEDFWFDRSQISYIVSDGVKHTPEEEGFCFRCVNCGKNVDVNPSYYGKN